MDPRPQSEAVSQQLAEVCGVLAYPGRLRILDRLARRPHTAAELAGVLHIAPTEILNHLQALSRCDLVMGKAARPDVIYALANQCTVEAISLLHAVGRNAATRRNST